MSVLARAIPRCLPLWCSKPETCSIRLKVDLLSPIRTMSDPKQKSPAEEAAPVRSAPHRCTLAIVVRGPAPHRRGGENQHPRVELQPTKADRKRKARTAPEETHGNFQSMGSHQACADSSGAEQIRELSSSAPATPQLPRAKRLKYRPSYGREILEARGIDVWSQPFPMLALATTEGFDGARGVQEDRVIPRQAFVEDFLLQINNIFPQELGSGDSKGEN